MKRDNVPKNRGKKYDIGWAAFLAFQGVIYTVCAVLLKNGSAAVWKMAKGDFDAAIEMIDGHGIEPSDEVTELMLEEVDDAVSRYATGALEYSEAYERIHRFDTLRSLGYDPDASGACDRLYKIEISRKYAGNIGELLEDKSDIPVSCAQALELCDKLSPEDKLSYSKADEYKENCFSRLVDHLDYVAAKSSAVEYFEEAGRFIDSCKSEKYKNYCIDLCRTRTETLKGEFEQNIDSLVNDRKYEESIKLIESAGVFYVNDREYRAKLSEKLGECVQKWTVSLSQSYCFDSPNAFDLVEKYSESYPEKDLAGTAVHSFEEYLRTLRNINDYPECVRVLEKNSSHIQKYGASFGCDYQAMYVSAYTGWISYKKQNGEFIRSENGESALELAKAVNKKFKDSCDTGKLIEDAKTYEIDKLIEELNEMRAGMGADALTKSHKAFLLAEQLLCNKADLSGDNKTDTVMAAVGECGIELTRAECLMGIYRRSDSQYAGHTEFLRSIDIEAYRTNIVFKNAGLVGAALDYDERKNSFDWYLVILSDDE